MEFEECTSCPGYCCMQDAHLHTPLKQSDITRIAKHLRIPIDQFLTLFVHVHGGRYRYEDLKDIIAHWKPHYKACPFLRQGLCGINDVKPEACVITVPMQADNKGMTCQSWHKMRLGWKF